MREGAEMCGSQIWMVPKVEKGATATMQTTLLPASMLMRGQRNREARREGRASSRSRGKVHTSKPPPKLIQISCSNLFMWASFSGVQFTLRKCLQQSDLVKLGGTSPEEGKGYSITEEARKEERQGERERKKGVSFCLPPSLRRRSSTPSEEIPLQSA